MSALTLANPADRFSVLTIADEVLGRTVTETIIPPRFRTAHDSGMRRFSLAGSAASSKASRMRPRN